MKIVKPGKLPCDKKYTCSCIICKCKFEFTAGEARVSEDPRDGCKVVCINCPTCGQVCCVNS